MFRTRVKAERFGKGPPSYVSLTYHGLTHHGRQSPRVAHLGRDRCHRGGPLNSPYVKRSSEVGC